MAQVKPLDFVLGTLPASTPTHSYTIQGFGPNSGTNFFTSRSYHLNFGTRNSTTPGFNRIIKMFKVTGETYSLTKAAPGELPFKSDLGLAPSTTIYGISLMASGVSSPTVFGSETPEANGGLDFMAGGGFFTKALTIKGNVWVDADGKLEKSLTG